MEGYTQLKTTLLKDKEIKKHYEDLSSEFILIRALIKKRIEKGLTQSDLARKIGTRQSAISRLESGRYNPTVGVLRKVARALDADLKISIR